LNDNPLNRPTTRAASRPTRTPRSAAVLRRATALRCAAAAAVLFLLPLACAREKPVFDADRAWTHLVAQCDYGPRVPGTAARDSVTFYLTRTLVRCGAEISTQRFVIGDPYGEGQIEMINVFASFYPDRPKRVLLAAHYDSRPWADEEEDDSLKTQPVLGANDGASGVAVLIEVGRLLGLHDPGGVGVDLVFFDGEDYGKKHDIGLYLIGSKYFSATRPDYVPVCGILLDMVAGKEGHIAKEGNSVGSAPRVTEELFRRAERMGLEFFHQVEGPPMIDDHVPFLMRGIEMVDLFGYEYPQWHTVHDTPEHCSQDRLAQVGALLVDFLYDFPF
jgi:hypothetical protein